MPLFSSLHLVDTTNVTTNAEHSHLVSQFRQLTLFDGLPTPELETLSQVFTVTTARPGDVLERQDRPVRHWHLITSGHALVQRDGTALGLLGHGESWSEHSLLSEQPSPISVVAFSPLTLLSLSRRHILSLPSAHSVLAERIRTRAATSADRLALPVFGPCRGWRRPNGEPVLLSAGVAIRPLVTPEENS